MALMQQGDLPLVQANSASATDRAVLDRLSVTRRAGHGGAVLITSVLIQDQCGGGEADRGAVAARGLV